MRIKPIIAGWKVLRRLALVIFFGSVVFSIAIVIISYRLKTAQQEEDMLRKSVSSTEVIGEFIVPVTTVLKTIQSWSGVIGKPNNTDPGQQALILFSLLSNKPVQWISGLTIADNTGDSIYLYKENNHWLTRITDKEKVVSSEISSEKIINSKTELKVHDPEMLDWYLSQPETQEKSGEILWAKSYILNKRNQEGVSAFIKLHKTIDGEEKTQVVVCDIRTQDIKSAFDTVLFDHKGLLFLMNKSGNINNLTPTITSEKLSLINAVIPDSIQYTFFRNIARIKQDEHTIFSFQVNNRKWWGSISPGSAKTSNAHLCIALPDSDLTGGGVPFKYIIFIISLLLFALTALILSLLIGRYGKRLEMISGYKKYSNASPNEIEAFIEQGENDVREFKSTLRFNLKTEKKGKEIEIASLKTIVAFMNSVGGTLLIGVGDDGAILGLEADGFENDDKILLHFNSILAQHIGLEFSGNITFGIVEIRGNKILIVDIRKSDEPVFLKNKGLEEFYVRVGPGSRKLSTSEVIEYLKSK